MQGPLRFKNGLSGPLRLGAKGVGTFKFRSLRGFLHIRKLRKCPPLRFCPVCKNRVLITDQYLNSKNYKLLSMTCRGLGFCSELWSRCCKRIEIAGRPSRSQHPEHACKFSPNAHSQTSLDSSLASPLPFFLNVMLSFFFGIYATALFLPLTSASA